MSEILILDEVKKDEKTKSLTSMKYGEAEFKNFNPETDLEFWENKHEREYMISITLPEFCCLCPRSGYPDFATIYFDYVPDKFVVELKTIKLYINSFMNRNISHEDSINEIYDVLYRKLAPKYMKIVGDFNPRGNVHTVIEICSENVIKSSKFERDLKDNEENRRAGARRIQERQRDKERDERRNNSRNSSFERRSDNKFKSDKPKRATREGIRSISYAGERKASVIKKDK